MEKCFSLEEIRFAVNVTIGDDGHKANQVSEILISIWNERERLLERKIQDEQSQAYEEKRINGL
tara:strand:- start:1426 stop:1617 length:192 start_codon:yes stop_codon:yes gene_type:complete